ncbi:hypothetical protein L356_06874, partial [Enterobacter sp. MGH 10]
MRILFRSGLVTDEPLSATPVK